VDIAGVQAAHVAHSDNGYFDTFFDIHAFFSVCPQALSGLSSHKMPVGKVEEPQPIVLGQVVFSGTDLIADGAQYPLA
jgi:hypothetical protein